MKAAFLLALSFLSLSSAWADDLITSSRSVTNADVSDDLKYVAYSGGYKGAWVRGAVNIRFSPDKTRLSVETEGGGVATIDSLTGAMWDSRDYFNEICDHREKGSLSPLGKRGAVLVKDYSNKCYGLGLVDLERNQAVKLAGTTKFSKVLFSSDDETAVVLSPYSPMVVNFTSSGINQRTLAGYSGELDGVISLDGRTVFIVERFVDLKANAFSTKVTRHNLSDDSRSVILTTTWSLFSPKLSPDGSKIAFLKSESWEHGSDKIFVLDLNTAKTVVTPELFNSFLGYSFDSNGKKLLIFTSDEGVISVNPSSGAHSIFKPWSFTGRVQISLDQKFYILQSWNAVKLCRMSQPSVCKNMPDVSGDSWDGRLEPIFSSDSKRVLQSVEEGILAQKINWMN